MSGWYRSHRAVQRGVSPKRGKKRGKWTHGSGDWFDGWLCACKRRCRFDFCQCEMTRGKIVLDGKSKENLENFWNTVLLSGVLILLDCACLSQIEATTDHAY